MAAATARRTTQPPDYPDVPDTFSEMAHTARRVQGPTDACWAVRDADGLIRGYIWLDIRPRLADDPNHSCIRARYLYGRERAYHLGRNPITGLRAALRDLAKEAAA